MNSFQVMGEVGFGDHISFGQNDHMLHYVLQFPNVSRPVIIEKYLHYLLGKSFNLFVVGLTIDFQKMTGQEGNVVLSFLQGGNEDGDYVEPVIEVLPKTAVYHLLG